jgi:hypothetical protein
MESASTTELPSSSGESNNHFTVRFKKSSMPAQSTTPQSTLSIIPALITV